MSKVVCFYHRETGAPSGPGTVLISKGERLSVQQQAGSEKAQTALMLSVTLG